MDNFIINQPDFQLTDIDFIIRLLVSTGIGLLIGLEREHAALPKQHPLFAGIRTFMLVVILGFLSVCLSFIFHFIIFPITLAGLIILIAVSYWVSSKHQSGATTEISVLISFLLGVLTFLGFIEISLAITVLLVAILSSKLQLHNFVGKISSEELYAIVKFGVMALLIFPFLPDRTIDPYEAINLREVGMIVLLISGLGFIGYILMRLFGKDYGILLSGIIGGFVSSTMITWIFAKKSKENPEIFMNCVSAIMAASTVMMARVFAWVFIFNRELFKSLTFPVGLILLTALSCTIYYHFKQKKAEKKEAIKMPLGKPLELKTTVIFTVIYISILFLINFTNEHIGERGIYLTTFVGSLADINAITISISQLANISLSAKTALNAIILATLCNTIIKIAISLWAGSKQLRKHIIRTYGLVFLSGIGSFLIIHYSF